MLLCLLTLLAACAPKENGPVPWQVERVEDIRQGIYYADGLAVDLDEQEGEPLAEVHVGVVQFSGADAATLVNERLMALWKQKLGEYMRNAQQAVIDAEFNGQLMPGQICYTQRETPAVTLNDGSLISLVMDGYTHTLGAAHSSIYRYAYNFDASSGQMFSLQDIWGEDAWERAAMEIYAQIESEGRLDDFYPGLKDNLLACLNENSWHSDGTNIYIIYNPYSIGPYALGIVEFTLPKE